MALDILREALETQDRSIADIVSIVEDNKEEWLQAVPDLESLLLDHTSLYHLELFLAVLHVLLPHIPPLSLLSWFDLLLRPSLKEPRLPHSSLTHARELVLAAALSEIDRIDEFRRRLFDLYLLDAFNETSEYDALEWAELDEEEQRRRHYWKANLQYILLQFAAAKPSNFVDHVHRHFQDASSRVQLLSLLNVYVVTPGFITFTEEFASHPLVSSILSSLLLDNSSTVCTLGLTLLGKLLPIFAVHAPADLKRVLPQLLAILGRIICWKRRTYSDDLLSSEPPIDAVSDARPTPLLQLRSDLGWQRLDSTFQYQSSPPPPRPFFTVLYYLFPCNLLRWLRSPVDHLERCGMESPYTVSWSEALDEPDIRQRAQVILQAHICHPLIIQRDAATELAAPDFFRTYDVSRIVTEAAMLDIRTAAQAVREIPEDSSMSISPWNVPALDETRSYDAPVISLEDMVRTSILLKSGIDLQIGRPSATWIDSVAPSLNVSPVRSEIPLPSEDGGESRSPGSPSHLAQVISGLQREALLLRNELNFELWLARENTKNLGRLYREQNANQVADVERLGLYTKLRKYRAQVMELERELVDQRQNYSTSKDQYADWNAQLQKKLREYREEKKTWISEAAMLRTAEKDAKLQFVAQAKLLTAANSEVSQLQTYKKENQHKIDRLHDYERELEQYKEDTQTWSNDFETFKTRARDIDTMSKQYKQMEIRLHSYEQSSEELQTTIRQQQSQNLNLQNEIKKIREQTRQNGRNEFAQELSKFAIEKHQLEESLRKQREMNTELGEEVEELRSMIQYLKSQTSGRNGLI